MEQCKHTKDREDVNNQLLNLSTILDSVLIDQSYQTLPSTMKVVSNKPSHQPSVGVNSKPSKKQKTKNANEDRKVDNKKSVPECICKESEDYREKFTGKHCMKRPKIGNFPMYVRFHTKGFCFTDCIKNILIFQVKIFPRILKRVIQTSSRFVEDNCLGTHPYVRCHYIKLSFRQTY